MLYLLTCTVRMRLEIILLTLSLVDQLVVGTVVTCWLKPSKPLQMAKKLQHFYCFAPHRLRILWNLMVTQAGNSWAHLAEGVLAMRIWVRYETVWICAVGSGRMDPHTSLSALLYLLCTDSQLLKCWIVSSRSTPYCSTWMINLADRGLLGYHVGLCSLQAGFALCSKRTGDQ